VISRKTKLRQAAHSQTTNSTVSEEHFQESPYLTKTSTTHSLCATVH